MNICPVMNSYINLHKHYLKNIILLCFLLIYYQKYYIINLRGVY